MIPKSIILAVEDKLSELVSARILSSLGIDVSVTLGLKGKNYLEKKARSLNKTAQGFPVLMIADQDSAAQCPPTLINSWVGKNQNPLFLLRVAVMEIESWIMADRKGIADFLSIPLDRIPGNPDLITQPKEFLVSLARKSKKKQLRDQLVPRPGATNSVGPENNISLGSFVQSSWNMSRALSVSPSLKRTMSRLQIFRAS
jgi:hypothetical protein